MGAHPGRAAHFPQWRACASLEPMHGLLKKLHIYLGLLNFSILFVFGIAGLRATVSPAPENRSRPAPALRLEAYDALPSASDSEVASDVYRRFGSPLAGPPPQFALRRDGENNLTFTVYSPNGTT